VRAVRPLISLMATHGRRGAPWGPDLKPHPERRRGFPSTPQRINAFKARHGHFPKLATPRGYESWARHFHETELGGRPLVIINPRQSSLTENPAATRRDAPLAIWHAFIDAVGQRRPDGLVVMVGGFPGWGAQ